MWLTLFVLVILAGAGGAYWWFQPQLPSLTVPPAVTNLVSRLKQLPARLKDLPFLKKKRPVAGKPRSQPQPAVRPQAQQQTPPPSSPPPAGLAAPPSRFTRLDRVGDSLTIMVRSFNDRAAQFDRKQLGCAGLAHALVTVEERWAAYTAARRAAGVLDAAHAARDQTFYAGVDGVEHRFEKTGCERP